MPHHSRVQMVVIDVGAADHDRTLGFWQGATGRTLKSVDEHPEFHGARLPGGSLALLVQRLDEGPSRVHVDIHTDDLDAEVDRLERLGAVRIRQVGNWWVLKDPAGLLFCVVPNTSDAVNADNAARWD